MAVVGIPKENRPFEYRVGMTPMGVALLTAQGHECYVETGAGLGSGFSDTEYEKSGARITYNSEEVFRRADLILKVQRILREEAQWLRGEQTLMCFMMLSSQHRTRIQLLTEKKCNVISYELIEDARGVFPVAQTLSQIGGQMCGQIAAQFLQNDHGGTGILLGGTPGVPPADVAVIGAGVVGMNAARSFLNMGARVFLMDIDLIRLQEAYEQFGNRITTMIAYDFNIKRICSFVDVLVGAIQVPRHRTPVIVTREMVREMHPGALIIDMSIDQGGCVETSRPMQHDTPTFVEEGITHYCVPNVPGVVGRTATHAFLNAAWPYISQLAKEGLETAMDSNPALRRGLVMKDGVLMYELP